MTNQTSDDGVTLSSTGFVRRYMTGIFMILCLIVLSVLMGFSFKAGSLAKEQLRRQGQAFFREIVLTRQWAANHGGIYVKITPSVQINPYLKKIPGLKVVIEDQDGELYTLMNPALVTREISKLAAVAGIFKFRITSLKPFNPDNAPDAFERAALIKFGQGATEFQAYEKKGNEVYYRYMAPLVTEKSCLKCHGIQGYREGDTRGGISVTIVATDMMHELTASRRYLVLAALGIMVLIFVIIRFISGVIIKDLKSAELKLIEMATRDFLTGLFNRREAMRRLSEEISRAKRTGKPLSLILADIDHFKLLNDTYGHSMGDEVLREISHRFVKTMRTYDLVCRYGGEEFLIAAPDTGLETARELAERLRESIMELVIPFGTEAVPVAVTLSAGVTQVRDDDSIDRVISRVDVALYRAKDEGRNRVVTS